MIGLMAFLDYSVNEVLKMNSKYTEILQRALLLCSSGVNYSTIMLDTRVDGVDVECTFVYSNTSEETSNADSDAPVKHCITVHKLKKGNTPYSELLKHMEEVCTDFFEGQMAVVAVTMKEFVLRPQLYLQAGYKVDSPDTPIAYKMLKTTTIRNEMSTELNRVLLDSDKVEFTMGGETYLGVFIVSNSPVGGGKCISLLVGPDSAVFIPVDKANEADELIRATYRHCVEASGVEIPKETARAVTFVGCVAEESLQAFLDLGYRTAALDWGLHTDIPILTKLLD